MREKISAKLLCAIIATGLMTFSGVVSETAMNVTFPTLMREFSIGTATVQWLTTGYLLLLALTIPLSTFLRKRFSTKSLFISASVLFIGGTLLCAYSPDFACLLGGRLLQGIGTGVALPLMFNIILTQAPKSRIGLIMGIASLIVSMAPAIGPVLGGFVVDSYGWREIFLILLPLLLLSFLLGVTTIEPLAEPQPIRLNVGDYLLLALSFTCFIFAMEKAAEFGWRGAFVIGLFALSLLALVLFVARSLSSAAPLINLSVFYNRTFCYALVFILLIQLCVLGLGYLIPNYSQLGTHQSPSVAGLLLLPGCLAGAAMAPFSGMAYDHFGARKPILCGAVILLLALIAFALLGQHLTTPLFMLIYTFYAVGQGLAVGNTVTYGLSKLPKELSADGNAVLNTLQQLAGAIGTAIVATLVASAQNATPQEQLAQATIDGSQNAFILLAVLALIALFSVSRALTK
ncbi:DHA2 family efflux MFS transporter permease subunit [Necropsobacter rosorum]|uniref:DHA2 family efflux MFS transporter permease subunit n=1 Tax=Necropsobacter rosorum TaxID=908285 RepID=UPI000509CD09